MAFKSGVVLECWRSVVIVQCTRVKERGWNVAIIEVLDYQMWLEKYAQGS